jgi:hypothetical protein
MLHFRAARRWAGSLACVTLGIPAAAVLPLIAAAPVWAQQAEGVEKAAMSRLTGIALDNNALRLTSGAEMAEIRKQLDAMAKQAGGRRGADEMLVWLAPAYTGPDSAAPIMNAFAERMKAAGYQYETQETNSGKESGALVAAGKEAGEVLIGLWMKSEQLLMLAWCRVEKAAERKPESAPKKPTETAASVPLPADASAVLVPGKPALTRQMVDHTCQFLAYLLEAPLTVEQRAKIETSLVQDWRKKDPDAIRTVNDLLGLRTQIFPKPDAERDFVRKQIQPEFLKALRANKKDEGAKWMLAIYDAAHKPLAPGNPPLTRQMTDAYTELFFFMGSEVVGEKIPANARAKDAFAKMLAAGYAKAPQDAKKQLNQMPIVWAAVRVAWPRLPEAEKKAYRDRWAKDIQAMLPKPKTAPKTAAAPSKPSSTGSRTNRTESYSDMNRRFATIQAMQRSYQMQSQMMWQNHYSRINMTANIGNSPYRYVNAYGNPY